MESQLSNIDITYAIEHGIIPINEACVQDQIENMKRREYLEMHPYSIKLGKDGYWHTYLPAEGKGKRIAVKKKNESDIQNVVIDYWKQNTTYTFKKRYEIWVDVQKQRGRSNNTICKYESDYKRFFEGDEIENKDIKTIDDVYLCNFIERLLKRKEIPYRALKALMGYIKGVFDKAVRDRIIEAKDNPCISVDIQIYKKYCKQPVIKTAEERTFSHAEKSSLLRILDEKHKEKPDYITLYAVELSLFTGMRVGELSGLKWEDIDFERGEILIRHAEVHDRKTNEYYVSLPKSGKIRSFAITPEVEDVLNRVKKAELRYGYLSEYVFSDSKGRIHARTISECMREKTKGEEFYNEKCIHASRRTFNSELAMLGVPRSVRASILGNTERVNEQYYTYDISDIEYRKAMISKVNEGTIKAV